MREREGALDDAHGNVQAAGFHLPRHHPYAPAGGLHGHGGGEPAETTNPLILLALGAALMAVGWGGSGDFLSHFTVFILACFVGWQVVWNVSAALHTPLMSVTNAISGITLIGAILALKNLDFTNSYAQILGLCAVILATVNVVGGYAVTNRMLAMFRKKEKKK